jgi:sarcosine oxidase subunit gamma
VTPIAHLNVVLAQADDAPSYDLVLPSTFAESFLEWLEMSAAEFGYEIAQGNR